jgi:hypothetical protein
VEDTVQSVILPADDQDTNTSDARHLRMQTVR